VSSPLSFAVGLLGSFTRSPADFLATALLAALLAGDVLREAVRRPPPDDPRRADAGVLALLTALTAAAALGRGALVDAAAPLVRDTSAELLFEPTLYSSLEGAVLFAALAASAGALLLLLASAFAAVAGGGAGRRRTLPERALEAAVPGALILCAAAGFLLSREGAGVSGGLLAFLLAASAILGALALAGLAAVVVRAGPAQVRAQAAAAALLAVLAASGVATAHGAGRIWALRLFLADRLEDVGSPSNQWIEYNLGLTSERLTGAADVAQSAARDPGGAAFEAWTRTPLRDLPFLSALLLVDAPGSVLSRFSLLPPQDLELLPGIARAALRAPPGAIGRLVSETGRSLLYTGVPVSGEPGAPWAVAVVAEIAEPGLAEESAQYFLQNVFFSGPADPVLLAVRRGDPAPPSGRSLTLASGSGEDRFWISVGLGPYLPDLLDHLSLALTAALVTAALFLLHRTVLQALPAPPRTALRPLATFRGRVFAVLLALVALPLLVYTLLSFGATRHEIDQATRALAEESLRTAGAFLGPRLQAGGGAAELEAVLPEAARLVGQDLLLYRGGALAASSRPEIFQTGLLDRRMPGELYRRLAFGGERLVTERAAVGEREVLVAHLRTPWSEAGEPYVLASALLLRDVHVERDRRELTQALYVMFVLSLLALGVFAWVVSRQLASPLATLREGADRIARGELAHRLRGPDRQDEFGRLFSAFNTMAAGLQVSQGELVAEKGRMQAIVSSIGAGVLALDREGRIQLANRAARDLLDLPPDVAGLRPADVLPPAFWERTARALRLGHRREDEVRLADGDGSRTLHLTFAPLVGEGGERRGLVVVFEDLSAVLASQRAVAWEEMARQVAHEIKNPLTPIKLSLQHVARLLESPPADLPSRLRRTLDLVLSEIGRLERIAGEFSRFGARGREARPLDPEPVLRDVAALYAPAGGPRVELAVEGTPTSVRADEDGLKKILVNLLENAREAMGAPGGDGRPGPAPGRADGGSGAAEPGEPGILLALRYDAAPAHAEIVVRDTGPGIAREDLGRLFEPYFSTKTRGTGLGLAIARRIVEGWGGAIEARNWERGAEVVLRLEKSPSPPA
jgi:signal transduction histidine kinase/HAMP domain-containing protein